jgi:hypothetical protein
MYRYTPLYIHLYREWLNLMGFRWRTPSEFEFEASFGFEFDEFDDDDDGTLLIDC